MTVEQTLHRVVPADLDGAKQGEAEEVRASTRARAVKSGQRSASDNS